LVDIGLKKKLKVTSNQYLISLFQDNLNQQTVTYFYEKFKELSLLYYKVREYIIMAEQYSDKFAIPDVNEIRMSFDHVFRWIDSDISIIKSEYDSAERHLLRAGYDACEICAIVIADKIKNMLNDYEAHHITKVFKEYYTDIAIKLDKITHEELVRLRMDKKYEKGNSEDKFENHTALLKEMRNLHNKIKKIYQH
jgi:hypothetical protein